MQILFLSLAIIKTLLPGGVDRGVGKIMIVFNNDFVLGEKYVPPVHKSKLQNLATNTKECDKWRISNWPRGVRSS